MNCDDQLGIVKRDDDSHPLSTDVANVCPLPVSAELDALRRSHEPFAVGNRRSDLPRPVLCVSREAHMCLSPGARESLPPEPPRSTLLPSTGTRTPELREQLRGMLEPETAYAPGERQAEAFRG